MEKKAKNDDPAGGMPYGVRMRCGNFYVEKVTRALSKRDARVLRQELLSTMPKGFKGGQRASMPVMRVGDISGMWRIEYGVSSTMFHILDSFSFRDGVITDETCSRLLTMLFCDTTVVGDSEYVGARVKALNEFSLRVKASDVTVEQEERDIEVVKALTALKDDEEDVR